MYLGRRPPPQPKRVRLYHRVADTGRHSVDSHLAVRTAGSHPVALLVDYHFVARTAHSRPIALLVDCHFVARTARSRPVALLADCSHFVVHTARNHSAVHYKDQGAGRVDWDYSHRTFLISTKYKTVTAKESSFTCSITML